MTRKLRYDIPGPDWRCDLEQVATRGWGPIFGADLPVPFALVVEIGFGRGEFLMDLARRDPKTAFVGVEVSFKRVLKMARRVAATPLRNLRLVQAPGEVVLAQGLSSRSVGTFWVNFPDPWPKKRHAKKRFVRPEVAALLADRLVAGGTIEAATDDRAYAEQMDEVFSAEPLLENLHAPAHWLPEVTGRTQTGYEQQWRAQGRPMHFLSYRRRDGCGGPR